MQTGIDFLKIFDDDRFDLSNDHQRSKDEDFLKQVKEADAF